MNALSYIFLFHLIDVFFLANFHIKYTYMFTYIIRSNFLYEVYV